MHLNVIKPVTIKLKGYAIESSNNEIKKCRKTSQKLRALSGVASHTSVNEKRILLKNLSPDNSIIAH